MKEEKFEKTIWSYKSQVCWYNPKLFIVWYQKGKEEEHTIVIKTTRPCYFKENYLQCLLHLNEDFDDDLLQDAMILLGFDWTIYFKLIDDRIKKLSNVLRRLSNNIWEIWFWLWSYLGKTVTVDAWILNTLSRNWAES